MESERDKMESAELLTRLRLAIANQPDEIPAGWKTVEQFAVEWGMTNNAAGIVLQRATKCGAMERKRFRIQTVGRGVYPTPHYREIKASKSADTHTSKPA